MPPGAGRRRLGLDVLFILSSLPLRGLAGAEDPHSVFPRREADHQQAHSRGMTDDDFPLLCDRVILVVEDPSQLVSKDRQGFVE